MTKPVRTKKTKSEKAERKAVRGAAQKSRARFRSSPAWRDFRLQMIERDESKCQCCGIRYPAPKLQVHHKDLDKERYEELDVPETFVCLCSTCHKSLHSMERKVRNKTRAFVGSPLLRELVSQFFV